MSWYLKCLTKGEDSLCLTIGTLQRDRGVPMGYHGTRGPNKGHGHSISEQWTSNQTIAASSPLMGQNKKVKKNYKSYNKILHKNTSPHMTTLTKKSKSYGFWNTVIQTDFYYKTCFYCAKGLKCKIKSIHI